MLRSVPRTIQAAAAACMLMVLVAPSQAPARDWIEVLTEQVRRPASRLGPAIDTVLTEHQVGSTRLGTYLETLRFEGCLDIGRVGPRDLADDPAVDR